MKVKVQYDINSGLVTGNYPEWNDYSKVAIIDTENKTIDGSPYIEVTKEDWSAARGKTMQVIDGIYQEYIKPDSVKLQESKEAKIKELKKNRDSYLVSDYISHQATELVEDEDGDFTEGDLVYFSFKANATGNPASEPNSILLGAVLMGSANPSYFLRYSCAIIEGELVRKGYVKITPTIAAQLITHIQDRNLGAIRLTNNRERAINAASTIEEVNIIDITF